MSAKSKKVWAETPLSGKLRVVRECLFAKARGAICSDRNLSVWKSKQRHSDSVESTATVND